MTRSEYVNRYTDRKDTKHFCSSSAGGAPMWLDRELAEIRDLHRDDAVRQAAINELARRERLSSEVKP